MRSAVEARGLTGDPRLEIEASSQVIEMGESPVTALRGKPDSSIVRMAGSMRRKLTTPARWSVSFSTTVKKSAPSTSHDCRKRCP